MAGLRLGAAAATGAALLGSTAMAAVGVDSAPLRAAVTAAEIMTHEQVLQAIANAHGGNRASGQPGFDASGAYVHAALVAAGYQVRVQPFTFPFFALTSAAMARTAPSASVYAEGTDFAVMEYSGAGALSDAAVVPTRDIVIPPGATPSTSTSGCEAADFTPAPSGAAVALVQRGTCTFRQKALNAQAAGYDGVVIFNEGQPGRQDLLNGTLGDVGVTIPVVGTSYAVGLELFQLATAPNAPAPTLNLSVEATSESRSTFNVIADLPGGREDRVVVVGAHLDSVPEGPGINDNGSGTSTILEVARQLRALGVQPRNKVRFAFWGAEEAGLLGSQFYVSSLSAREIKNIALNLNFDMLGSPNWVRFIYDGDGSDTGTAGPNGSSVIENVFASYFRSVGLPTRPTAFDGRSDYGPFIDVGIPAGGLFSGADDVKTPEEAAVFGGVAGIIHDPCYHQPCDTIGNVNEVVLEQLADGVADAVLQFAMTTSAVKGTSRANDRAVKSVDADTLLYRGPRAQR